MILELISKMAASKNGHGRRSDRRFQIGGRVESDGLGPGTVQALDPSGAVIVRFDRQARSQSVFPTLLNKRSRR